jgi:hypothetical protein
MMGYFGETAIFCVLRAGGILRNFSEGVLSGC